VMPSAVRQDDNAEWEATPRKREAPRADIRPDRVSIVEHPCIIKNIDKGIKSLGGEYNIQHVRVSSSHSILLLI
jgi:general transcription factor 3C polypeptide 5 (transcription factor C subunit 1)